MHGDSVLMTIAKALRGGSVLRQHGLMKQLHCRCIKQI